MEYTNDADLLERIKNGDEEAFRIFFEYYKPILVLEAFYEIRDAQTAKTVVENVFTDFWRQKKTIALSEDKSLIPFLLLSTRSYCAKFRS